MYFQYNKKLASCRLHKWKLDSKIRIITKHRNKKKINSRTKQTHGEFSVKWRSYDHIKANSYNWQ